METFNNLRIGVRLAIAFALILLLLFAMAVVGGMQARTINHYAQYYPENILPSLKVIYRLDQAVSDARRLEGQYILVDDPAERKSLFERIGKARQAIQDQLKAYEPLVANDEDRGFLNKAKSGAEAYMAAQDKVLAASGQDRADPAKQAEARNLSLGPARAAFTPLRESITQWWGLNERLAAQTTEEAQAAYKRVLMTFALLATGAIIAGILAAIQITRSITKPVEQASQAVRAVAEGDLTVSVQSRSRDELGQLLGTLGHMTQNLSRIVAGVRTGCGQINVAATEIAHGNGDLSSRTESQASNLEETAASVEQITAQIKANAENAQQADRLAHSASETAKASGTAVSEVVKTMDGIATASDKIADIIGVIDGIAFQTNILALNAAVEAARAGEQGRGFAVVAGEVRLLAQRSAEAAKEIKNLINDSVAQVQSGSGLVHRAQETIEQMVDEVRKVTSLVGEITVSSREQADGVTQINVAVSQLDQATQQNAALVEETAAAAESLKQQTTRLNEAVAFFRVG
ncbi:methyl-accepting chemotaxis protein [Burkholderiaceae bacterium UC74_6]